MLYNKFIDSDVLSKLWSVLGYFMAFFVNNIAVQPINIANPGTEPTGDIFP